MRIPLPFIPPSSPSRSQAFNAAKLINAYTEVGQGKNNAMIINAPGFESRKTLGSGPIRAAISTESGDFFVSGNEVYKESDSSLIGTIDTYTGDIAMIDNGVQLGVFEGNKGWTYTYATSTFAEITDADLVNCTQAVFMDGYGVLLEADSARFWITTLYDFTAIDPLDFATAESKPDNAVAIVSDNDELIIFGKETTQFYYNSGNADFPFDKYPGTAARGCAAANSVVADDNTIFYLGDDRVFYRMNGRQPVRISTHAEEFQISDIDNIEDCYAFSYTQEGHKFYVISFYSGGITLVYDVSTQRWHQRKSKDLNYWRGKTAIKIRDKIVVGDSENGNIYNLKTDVYTEAGTEIQREIIFPAAHRTQNDYIHNYIELDVESGTGLETGQGDDPKIMLTWSDNGKNFGNDIEVPVGKIGDFDTKQTIYSLGISNRRDYKIRFTDPVKFVVLGVTIDVEECFR